MTAVFDPAWPTTQMGWGIHAPGLRDLLLHLARGYPEVPVMVTENGMALQEVGGRAGRGGCLCRQRGC